MSTGTNVGALGVGTTTAPSMGAIQSTGTSTPTTGRFTTVFAGVIR